MEKLDPNPILALFELAIVTMEQESMAMCKDLPIDQAHIPMKLVDNIKTKLKLTLQGWRESK